MAPITTSLFTDIEDAVCAEVLRLCGSGAEAYAEPAYLQLATARRGFVAQSYDVTPDEKPAFVIEYGFSDEIGPGGQTAGGDYQHTWDATVVLELKKDDMGFVAEPAPQEFYQAVQASAGVLMLRVHRALRSFAPSVLDEDFGEATSNFKVVLCRFITSKLDDYAYDVQILFELALRTEDLSM